MRQSSRQILVETINQQTRLTNRECIQHVIEEVAYTWFNRLIALRFMEVNDYLPSRIRVLSSADTHKQEPDIVTDPFATNIEFTATERAYILDLKDDNALDTLFRFLFIKQCNQLHNILPDLFEKTADYSELLLPFSFTDQEGVLYHLVHDIDEADFDVSETGQIEIIGWLYQYYISERRRKLSMIGKKVITKDNIPAATEEMFTTDWVVRYMVDNSLGRFWLERH